MTLDAVRLSLRLGRFEIVTFGLLLAAAIIGGIAAAAYIASLAPPAACLDALAEGGVPSICENPAFFAAQNTFAGPLTSALVALPFAMAAFVGVPIVARELERGTSRLAWSLAPSRWRWYLARVAPTLLLIAVLSLLAGHALDRLLAAAEPALDVSAAFPNFGFRGVVLASRAVFVFCLAVALGAILGRTLPAVILVGIVAVAGIGAGSDLHRQLLASEAVPVPEEAWDGNDDLFIEQRFQLPDGTLVGWDYFRDDDPYDNEGNTIYPQFMMAVPGERYRFAETVQAGALGAASVVALLLGGFVVGRRRPG